jgi:hypothetical protein
MRGATIRDKRDYLRADVVHRLHAADFEQFLSEITAAAFAHPSARLLIYVHVARASLKIEKFHASRFLDLLAAQARARVALVATYREVQVVQQYIETLARMKKANLRSFTKEAAAIAWLLTPVSAAKRPSARTRKSI